MNNHFREIKCVVTRLAQMDAHAATLPAHDAADFRASTTYQRAARQYARAHDGKAWAPSPAKKSSPRKTAKVVDYEVVSVSGATLTLKGANPKTRKPRAKKAETETINP